MAKKKKIVFVCTANVCRSVLAEHIFKRMMGPRADLLVSSAGTDTASWYRIEGPLADVLRPFGVDTVKHRGTPITRAIIEEADYLIVMELRHREILRELSPECSAKVHLLREFCGREEDFVDPLQARAADFPAVGKEIERCLKAFVKRERL